MATSRIMWFFAKEHFFAFQKKGGGGPPKDFSIIIQKKTEESIQRNKPNSGFQRPLNKKQNPTKKKFFKLKVWIHDYTMRQKYVR